MPSIKRIQFTATINAPADRVFTLMTGPESYKKWTSAFMAGSYYDGSWQQGEKIKFLAPSGGGMVAEIAENKPNQFISIRHLGFVMNGVEDTESEAVRAWAPAYENYTFESSSAGTKLIVDQEIPEEWEAHMTEAWPKALNQLKAICEAEGDA